MTQSTAEAGPVHKQELRRSLGLWHLVIYGLVFISPISPFPFFGILFNASHGMVPLAYVFGAVAMLFTVFSYMVMTEKFPVAGSVYAYASLTLGETAGFIAGWALLLDYILLPALICVGSSVAVHAAAPIIPAPAVVAALIGVSTTMNVTRVTVAMRANLFLLLVQLAILCAFFLLAGRALAVHLDGAHLSLKPVFDPQAFSASALLGATTLVVLSFLGFDAISLLAEEAVGARRVLGAATILALLISTALFVAQAYVASLFVLNKGRFEDGAPTYAAFYGICRMVGGAWLNMAVSLPGVLLQGVASGLACHGATSRLIYSMARDSVLPHALSVVNARTGTPNRAVYTVAGVTALIAALFLNNLESLTAMVSLGALTGFVFLHLSVVSLFLTTRPRPPWLAYLASPLIGLVIVGYLIVHAPPTARLVAAAWITTGLTLFSFARLRRRSPS